MGTFRDLTVYQKAFEVAMEIFQISKTFPKEETYSLTDQIRRSSRAVVTNIAEAYRKRQYPAFFSSKSSDADMENTETKAWMDFARACIYIDDRAWTHLESKTDEVGRLLGDMIDNPEKYCRKTK